MNVLTSIERWIKEKSAQSWLNKTQLTEAQTHRICNLMFNSKQDSSELLWINITPEMEMNKHERQTIFWLKPDEHKCTNVHTEMENIHLSWSVIRAEKQLHFVLYIKMYWCFVFFICCESCFTELHVWKIHGLIKCRWTDRKRKKGSDHCCLRKCKLSRLKIQ